MTVTEPAQLVLAGREAVALAERDVRGGVLVEQGVEEDGLQLADPAVAVDERNLAQARRALVARRIAAQDVRALLGVESRTPA